MNVTEFVNESGYGFPVKKFDAYAKVNGAFVKVPNRQFTGRDDTENPIIFEAVSPSYQIIQNAEGFAFLSDLVDSGDLVVDNMLDKGDGRVVIINTYMPDHIEIAGSEVRRYLAFCAKHDKSGSAFALAHNVQLSCTNQLNALQMGKCKYTIRHSRNAKIKLHDARQAMGISFKYADNLQKIGNELATQKIDKTYYKSFLRDVVELDKLNKDKNPRAYRNAIGTQHRIHTIMKEADYISNYRNTKWGLYQAITDVVSNTKRYNSEGAKFMQTAQGAPLTNRAFEILTTT